MRLAFLTVVVTLAFAAPCQAQVRITEVAPWSSGNSPVGEDWFELTNFGGAAVDITGWRMDDNSNSFGVSVQLVGVSTIAPGQSVVFIETTSASTVDTFKSVWFGGNVPAGFTVGTYNGSGVGLSTGGDAVNIYNASGVLQANVSFGSSPTGPFPTFDNAAGLNGASISQLSVVGVNGAFAAPGDSAEIGSPGRISATVAVPEPAPLALAGLGAAAAAGVLYRRRMLAGAAA